MNDKGQARQIERSLLRRNRNPVSKADEASGMSFNVIQDILKSGKHPPRGGSDAERTADAAYGQMESELLPPAYADRTPPHQLHVFSHRRNTHITLTRPNGEPMLSLSCGNLGFRKAARGGYDPAYQLTAYAFQKIHEKGLLVGVYGLELTFRDFGPGRDAFVKVLLGNEGAAIRGLIKRVTDSTRIKFGGTRSRHERRLG